MSKDSKSLAVRMVSHFAGTKNSIVVPVLFVRLLGNYEAAAFLSQCMYWTERATRPDGTFYKSLGDWKEELELSPHQVRRVTRDCAAYVDCWRGGENGVNHYRVNLLNVAEAIEQLLNSQSLENQSSKADEHGEKNPDVKQLNNRMCRTLTTGSSTSQHPTIYTKITAEITAEEERRPAAQKTGAAAAFFSEEEKRKKAGNQPKAEGGQSQAEQNRQGGKSQPSLDKDSGNAGKSNGTDFEDVPGAARAALEKCFAKAGFLDDLLTEYDDRPNWLKLPPDFIFATLGKMRTKHGRKYATPLIAAFDDEARRYSAAGQEAESKKTQKAAVENEINDILGD